MNTENVDMGGLLLMGWFVLVILAALIEGIFILTAFAVPF